jgi:SET domain-containing protein
MPKQKQPKQPPGVWTAHLSDKKDKEEFEAYVRNSRGVFDRALDLIDNHMINEEVKPEDYDNPSWSHKQADKNGWNRALKKVRQLFV